MWAGRGRVFVGRDTRGSGPELEQALARGIVSAGGAAVLGGVLPTPAVALLAQDLGIVISASHNPPEYNGVKFFDAEGHKLGDADEEAIEALLDAPRAGRRLRRGGRRCAWRATSSTSSSTSAARLDGLRIAVDCANGAFSAIAPGVFERLGAEVTTVAAAPDGTNINVGCGATDLGLLQEVVRAGGYDLGIAFDGDGDRMLAVDEAGTALDGDQILAVIALALRRRHGRRHVDDESRLPSADGRARDSRADDRRRRPLRARGAAGRGRACSAASSRATSIFLDGHVTGDGLAAALLLCRALGGRPLSRGGGGAAALPQATENVAVARRRALAGGCWRRSSGSKRSSPGAAGCSCGRRERSRSCAFSWRPRASEEAAALCGTVAISSGRSRRV